MPLIWVGSWQVSRPLRERDRSSHGEPVRAADEGFPGFNIALLEKLDIRFFAAGSVISVPGPRVQKFIFSVCWASPW